MKKAKRRRAASASPLLTSPKPLGRASAPGHQRDNGTSTSSSLDTNRASPRTASTAKRDRNLVTRKQVDNGHGLSHSFHGTSERPGSPGGPGSDQPNGILLDGDGYWPGRLRDSPPDLQQTLLASVVDELEKVSRHSLNWDEFFGSSLDLAPSLLDLYDGIIASASKEQDGRTNKDKRTREDNGQLDVDGDFNDGTSTSSANNEPDSPDTSKSPNACNHHIASGIHKRTGSGGKQQLPSLSVPPDRPVSMAEAEALAPSSGDRSTRLHSVKDAQQKKQRPLSMSSGTVPSSSPSGPSLSGLRHRQTAARGGRTIKNIDEDIIPEDSSDEVSDLSAPSLNRCRGHCTKKARKIQPTMPSSVTLSSESRNSVDSGCVLNGDGSISQIKGKGTKGTCEHNSKVNYNANKEENTSEANQTSCSCYLYDDMSISSSDTAGSGSFSYRDEVDSSTSSIRDGSAPLLTPLSSSSSSASSLPPTSDKSSGQDIQNKDNVNARRKITGLPTSVSEGFLSSASSVRKYNPAHNHCPSSLPLGHHYPNYQPLDERLATSPDATSKYLGFFSPANDSGLATDRQASLSSTPGSRVSGPVASPWSNSSSIVSCSDEAHFTGSESPDSSSPSTNRGSNPAARRSSSFSKSEARKRFFSNYEEHMRQLDEQQKAQLEENVTCVLGSVKTEAENVSAVDSSNSTCKVGPESQSPHTDKPEMQSSSPENSSLKKENNHRQHDATLGNQPSSSRAPSSQPLTNSTTFKSVSKDHPPPTSPVFSPSPSTGHRISSSGHSSKSAKKREGSSSSADVKSTGSGYVSYVQRVVAEILESERTYIASLKDIIQGYLEPMEKILGSTDASEDLACLFGNIREIFKFGCQFLADLELTSLDPVKVAECFVKHNEGFVIYTDYCTNYPRAVEVLTRFMQHPQLSEMCKERQLALGHGLPLGAYLLRPVQRILKYHLLLQNIVKNCEKENGGSGSRTERGSTSSTMSTSSTSSAGASAILEQAFQHMTHMASHINEMKRKHEHAVRIQEIQSQLEDYVGEDLTRLGDLVLESTFRVYGAKASRQVFLFERGLLISKKKEGGMLSCKTFIRCSNLMLVEVIPNEPLSFHTIPFDNPRAQYTLQARNMEQKRRWCQEMKRLILESYKGKIPDNVKSLVMQLGRNHDDDYVTKEALEAVRKNQHTAPEYLEKRRFRRKSGPRLPDFSLLKPQRARKGANNKKGENKGLEINKLSPELWRRAESKSPDSQRKFLIKQVGKKRSQSQTASLPTTPLTETNLPELFERTNQNRQDNNEKPQTHSEKSGAVKTSTPEKNNQRQHPSHTSAFATSSSSLSSLTSHVATALMSSPESMSSALDSTSNYETDSKTRLDAIQNDAEENEDDSVADPDAMESLITKRATSFRKALRAHPITSADISELVVRCGGTGSIRMSPSKSSSTKNKSNVLASQDSKCSDSMDKKANEGKDSESSSLTTVKDIVQSDLDNSDNEDDEFHRNNEFRLSNENIESQISEMSRAISNGNFLSHLANHSNETSNSAKEQENEVSAQKKSIASRSASLPLLNDSDDDEDCTGSEKCLNDKSTSGNKDSENFLGQQCTGASRKHQQQHKCSHSVEDVCGEPKGNAKNTHSGRGRMSRRDLQDRAAHFKKKSVGSQDKNCNGVIEIGTTDVEELKTAKDSSNASLTANKSSQAKSKADVDPSAEKTVLLRNKVKGLRLPNTHRHLSVQDYTSISALRNRALADGSKAKLIGWSSADKLTKGSMTDVSHLSEDPWVRNTEVVLTEKEKKKTISSASLPSKNDLHQYVNSNSTNLNGSSSCEGSKENLDWLVYLNRNASGSSSSPLNPASSLPSHFSNQQINESKDKLSSVSVSQGINITDLSQHRNIHTSYGTPPTAVMVPKNMFMFRSSSGASLKSDDKAKGVVLSQSTLVTKPCPTKITLTKPVKLQETSNLSRSNSLPTTSCYGKGMSYSALKSLSRNRHSSIQNVDNLSEQESAQKMIAEMEEYIKAVTEPLHESASHRCLPKRFPTSLPAITVEEEDPEDNNDDDDTQPSGSNRLSVISSVSTSSYESQGSCSSGGSDEILGGLIGTLKHKLNAWAKDSNFGEEQEKRNNSSSNSSTINHASALASDDESDDVYLESETPQSDMHSNWKDSLKVDKSLSNSKITPKHVPSENIKLVNEERQLENVLREHSLGSSSLGLRMANMAASSGNPIVKESSDSSQLLQTHPEGTIHSNSNISLMHNSYPSCGDTAKMNNLACEGDIQPDRSLKEKGLSISESSKSTKMHSNDDYDNCICDTNISGQISGRVSTSVCDVNSSVNGDIIGQDKANSALTFSSDPLATRFSLPPTKEATEALMPPALRGDCYEIQQSDSGFSLQSTASSSNDGSSSNGDLAQSLDTSPLLEEVPVRLEQRKSAFSAPLSNNQNNLASNPNCSTSEIKNAQGSLKLDTKNSEKSPNSVVGNFNKTLDLGMRRTDSCASMDSTDSFYERRLSVAFESDAFSNLPSVMKARQDLQFDQRSVDSADELAVFMSTAASSGTTSLTTATMSRQTFPLALADAETPLSRKSIREYVQSIEEMFKPQSPKVVEVRRREPGTMIRQRLQNLRDQVVYGKDSSDERGHCYPRSKSQPPSQHRTTLLPSSSHSSISSITSGCGAEGSGPGSYQPRCSDDTFVNDRKVSGSRDSLVSIPNATQPCALWGSRESVFFPSRSKERLNSSKERLYSSRENLLKDKSSSSINLTRSGSKEIVTRESILASPVLARKDSKSACPRPQQHQHLDQGYLLSPAGPSSPAVFDGEKTLHGQDLAAKFSLPPTAPHHWHKKNQFVHRARSSSDRSSVSLSERSCSPVFFNSDSNTEGLKGSPSFSCSSPLLDSQQQQLSRSTGRLDQMSTEVENLVIMKGWVRSLISKFQDQP